MSSLSDKAGFLIVANFIKYAVGFVMPMVLVRLLNQADYGTYQQMQLVNTIVSGILTLGLPTSVYYFFHHVKPHQHAALRSQTTWMLIASGCLAGLGVAWAAGLIGSRMNNATLVGLLPLYALSIAFLIASEQFTPFMISQDRYRVAVSFETGETIVRVLILIVPLSLGYGLKGLVLAAVMYAALRFVLRTVILFKSGGATDPAQAGAGQSFVKEQLAYSTPLALMSIVGLVGGQLDRGLVAAYFTPVDYAIYSVGALEIPLDVIFQASVANVLRASLPPLIRDGRMQEVTRLMRESVRKLAIIVLPSFIFLYGHSQEFITLLFTSRYEQSVSVFRIYLFLIPLHMFVLSMIPQIFGKTKTNLYIVITTATIHLMLSFVLLKVVGFYGPAISGVVSSYIASLIFFMVAKRLIGATLSEMLPWLSLAKVVAAALAGLVAARALGAVTASGLMNLTLGGVLYSVVFFAVGAVIGLFTEGDWALARRWLGKVVPQRVRG
ncbi:lipopolysaccharide biosynthesis protein [Aquabacterium sp.]|uniref:lipopolysaccharide biosynthesis protein n=1 Tax=Aquabacterium sp. TaxID=1872578 RepID=UPI0035AEA5E0